MANELQEGVPPKPIPRTSSNLKKLLLILNGALMFHVICYETSWIPFGLLEMPLEPNTFFHIS